MNDKYRPLAWLCLTALVVAGLKYVPPYLLEQRRLDQQDRVLDLKERMYLKQNRVPAADPAPAPAVRTGSPRSLLL